MSYSESKSRYPGYRTSSKRKSKTSLVILAVAALVIALMSAVCMKLWQHKKTLESLVMAKVMVVNRYEQELSILRTLNPYHVGTNEVLQQAVAKVDLFPGWITRVYPLPESHEKAMYMVDLGSFVMNETRFSLSSHQRYGITKPNNSMYRMNGLMPSHIKGRYQIGVEFYINQRQYTSEQASKGMSSCYARVDVNQKRVIDQRLRIFTHYNSDQMLTGEVELNKGLFPISALVYCDKKSDFNGEQVEVMISFRKPNQNSLSSDRYSVFHIYNPENITANVVTDS